MTSTHEREGVRGLAAVALAAIVVITMAWWALALWPVSEAAPEWVLRTRLACFGARASELPHAGGWILLIGEPIGMAGTLFVVWGRALGRDLGWLRSRHWGRGLLTVLALSVGAGVVMAARRVSAALAGDAPMPSAPAVQLSEPGNRRLAPALRLTDQTGATFDLASLSGRSVIVTFAFRHCETVCPTLVRRVMAERAESGVAASLVIVTVDPWRDTPERLPHIVREWSLAEGDVVLSGAVEDVTRALDAWGVSIVRDEATGDVAHPALVVLVDAVGQEAARLLGADGLASLLKD